MPSLQSFMHPHYSWPESKVDLPPLVLDGNHSENSLDHFAFSHHFLLKWKERFNMQHVQPLHHQPSWSLTRNSHQNLITRTRFKSPNFNVAPPLVPYPPACPISRLRMSPLPSLVMNLLLIRKLKGCTDFASSHLTSILLTGFLQILGLRYRQHLMTITSSINSWPKVLTSSGPGMHGSM
jgi:hypothetical protein